MSCLEGPARRSQKTEANAGDVCNHTHAASALRNSPTNNPQSDLRRSASATIYSDLSCSIPSIPPLRIDLAMQIWYVRPNAATPVDQVLTLRINLQANLPNLRRLFVESRTEAEENEYSRNAVRPYRPLSSDIPRDISVLIRLPIVLQSRSFHFFRRSLQSDRTTNGRGQSNEVTRTDTSSTHEHRTLPRMKPSR